eukprot:1240877-Pleurochrysis_carterae.AAC.1
MIWSLPASPRTSRRSVAPPMRQLLPPKCFGSMPHASAMRFARSAESFVVHGVPSSAAVKSGVLLALPRVRSRLGTACTRSSHIAQSAS